MTTPPLLCAAFEVALNRLLRLEPNAVDQCMSLWDRPLALEVTDIGWRFVIEPVSGGVRVSEGEELKPAVTARAPTIRLLAASLQTLAGRQETTGALEIEGDAEVLQRFTRILRLVGFDPEELIAQILGDVAAHRLVGGIRNLAGWGRRSLDSISYSTAEYLREETGDLARGGDVEEWERGVDALRDGIDRLEARIELLTRSSDDEATA